MAPEIVADTINGLLSLSSLKVTPSLVNKLPEGQNELVIARIFGKASSIDSKEDKANGTTQQFFRGTFEGINMQKNTAQRAGKLLLPKGVGEIVEKAMRVGNEEIGVAFAFEIRSVKTTAGGSYTYKAVVIKAPQAEDELAELRSIVVKYGKGAGTGGTRAA